MRTLFYLALSAQLFSYIYLQKTKMNLEYGSDSSQIIDIYEPEDEANKAILLVHGGAWIEGSREDMRKYVNFLRREYPQYIIANMDYRLGNALVPGYPKQLIDIQEAIKFMSAKYDNKLEFALFGESAGAHLAMLYGYKFNDDGLVKAIVDIVGPADFTDKAVTNEFFHSLFIMNFIGPYLYLQNPDMYNISSPITWITPSSPSTIGFYGEDDIRFPSDLVPKLHNRLAQNNVTNEFYKYPGGHADWDPEYQQDMRNKTVAFLNKYF